MVVFDENKGIFENKDILLIYRKLSKCFAVKLFKLKLGRISRVKKQHT